MARTTVTLTREVVSLSDQEAADRMAAIRAILQKYLPLCLISPLTPAPIPVKLEVKQPQGEGER